MSTRKSLEFGKKSDGLYHPSPCLRCNGDKWRVLSISEFPSWKTILYRHFSSGFLLKHYIAYWPDLISPENEKLILKWRLYNPYPNIVQTIQSYEPHKNYSCGLKVSINSVLTEYLFGLSSLLEEKSDQEELLTFIYKLALDWVQGFEQLTKIFTSFEVSEGMLGWNLKKVGKVWVNENFALNSARRNVPYAGDVHEKYVVRRIFSILNEVIGMKRMTINFREGTFLETKKHLNIILKTKREHTNFNLHQIHPPIPLKSNHFSSTTCCQQKNRDFSQEATRDPKNTEISSMRVEELDELERVGYDECASLKAKVYSEICLVEKEEICEIESLIEIEHEPEQDIFFRIQESQIILGNDQR